ncbi:hypothetical protein AUTU_20780 [Aureibacter tunicatorum]|nr:hypothetical protein AUTU_20780 [Aureibacter tunicatorum]
MLLTCINANSQNQLLKKIDFGQPFKEKDYRDRTYYQLDTKGETFLVEQLNNPYGKKTEYAIEEFSSTLERKTVLEIEFEKHESLMTTRQVSDDFFAITRLFDKDGDVIIVYKRKYNPALKKFNDKEKLFSVDIKSKGRVFDTVNFKIIESEDESKLAFIGDFGEKSTVEVHATIQKSGYFDYYDKRADHLPIDIAAFDSNLNLINHQKSDIKGYATLDAEIITNNGEIYLGVKKYKHKNKGDENTPNYNYEIYRCDQGLKKLNNLYNKTTFINNLHFSQSGSEIKINCIYSNKTAKNFQGIGYSHIDSNDKVAILKKVPLTEPFANSLLGEKEKKKLQKGKDVNNSIMFHNYVINEVIHEKNNSYLFIEKLNTMYYSMMGGRYDVSTSSRENLIIIKVDEDFNFLWSHNIIKRQTSISSTYPMSSYIGIERDNNFLIYYNGRLDNENIKNVDEVDKYDPLYRYWESCIYVLDVSKESGKLKKEFLLKFKDEDVMLHTNEVFKNKKTDEIILYFHHRDKNVFGHLR